MMSYSDMRTSDIALDLDLDLDGDVDVDVDVDVDIESKVCDLFVL